MLASNVRAHALACACAGMICAGTLADSAPWITLVKENDRLIAEDALGVGDTQQKKYAWGDLNNNGWIDLVVMRKQPFTSPGKRANVLFLNEGGVLVDRTEQYASAVDHDQITTPPGWPSHDLYPADEGFLTPTNDRDVALVDVLNNGWLDMVTAAAISDDDPKHIGHPRVYINLANDDHGQWQGFRFENARIPAMLTWDGNAGHNPRFSAVGAGDVTGNGYADLYFADHDASGAGGSGQPAGADFNDKFLVNAGESNPGYFSDETSTAFSGLVSIPNQTDQPFPLSSQGWAAAIADVSGNGHADIVKVTTLTNPLYIGVAYNNPQSGGGLGSFESEDYHVVAQAAAYYFTLADLNNNGRLDIVISDAGTDRYRLSQSNDENGHVIWGPIVLLPQQSGPGAPFSGNSVVVDLDNSGFMDIIIADVAFDIAGCSRLAGIYRNRLDPPEVTFLNASHVIPNSDRTGVFDVAALDITGNGWTDLVLGRCSGTDVWINVPPTVPCPGDLTGDGNVGVPDLIQLLSCWGEVTPGSECADADLTNSGTVGVGDLIALLGFWGACP